MMIDPKCEICDEHYDNDTSYNLCELGDGIEGNNYEKLIVCPSCARELMKTGEYVEVCDGLIRYCEENLQGECNDIRELLIMVSKETDDIGELNSEYWDEIFRD